MRETLLQVIRTLETVELRGQDNMLKLLGCIRVLTDMAEQPEHIPRHGTDREEDIS